MLAQRRWPRAPMVSLMLAVTALLGAGAFSVPATAAPVPDITVLSAGANPSQLAPGGGTVTVTGVVLHAATCQLELLSIQSFAVVYSHNPRSCTSGSFSARVTIGPNPTAVARTVAFDLVVRNGVSAATEGFYVELSAALTPTVASAIVSPSQLPPVGGTVTVTGVVLHASTCQLELLSVQSFAVIYSHNPRSCTSGGFSARVTIGPNRTGVPRTVAFALVARNRVSSSGRDIYVVLAAGATKTVVGTPPGTTTGPSAGTSVPVVTSQSSNWSGYAAIGGPYTVVTGSFTVRSLSAGAFGYGEATEWVGVDGISTGDPSLIQAGVDEYPDPSNPATVDVQAWWEILPATVTNITSLNVKAGDKVTVTIWQLSATTWAINLTDGTGNQSFTTPPEQYSGPGSSAEWIVEATTECRSRCRTVALAPYSPPVLFSGLGMTGPQATSLEAITMVQGAGGVSTPSALSAAGFTVTYTGGVPAFGQRAAPLGVLGRNPPTSFTETAGAKVSSSAPRSPMPPSCRAAEPRCPFTSRAPRPEISC